MCLRKSYVIFLSALLLLVLPNVRPASAMQSPFAISIRGFSVQGVTNDSLPLVGSPAGVNFDGINFRIFTTMFWPDAYTDSGGYQPAYLLYLVSTSQNDFAIAYVYLHASGNYQTFTMYYYDYDIGFLQHYVFTGTQSVSTSESLTSIPVTSPPSFIPEAKYANQVWLQGTNLNIQGNAGIYNGEQVFVLLNVMNVLNQWNEVWTITSNYHFIVFYTYFNQPKAVTINDLDLASARLTVNVIQGSWGLIQPTSNQSSEPLTHRSGNFGGTWYNKDQNTRDIAEVQIWPSYLPSYLPQDSIHVWEACEPSLCDWGPTAMNVDGDKASATFTFSFKVVQLTITLVDPNTLAITNFSHYTDSSGRSDYTITDYFSPAT